MTGEKGVKFNKPYNVIFKISSALPPYVHPQMQNTKSVLSVHTNVLVNSLLTERWYERQD
jgi:hypothetical protein